MQIKSNEIKLVDLDDIKLNNLNSNKHPPEQIDRLAELIKYQGFRVPGIISNRSGVLIAGEGKYLAAKKLGMTQMPIIYQDFDSDEQETAFGISDNAIAAWANLDLSFINTHLPDLGPDFDVDMLGIKDFRIDASEKDTGEEKENIYSEKISSPSYEPKKDSPPPMTELFTTEKYFSLVKQINEKNLPENLRLFLTFAASRHIVFNYENIAEFYCHQNPEVQDLMEKSALVIIDFNKAIEEGFIKLTDEIKDIVGDDQIEMEDE